MSYCQNIYLDVNIVNLWQLKVGFWTTLFLLLPFSAVRIYEIVAKGPYNPFYCLHNHFIITIIIIHKYPQNDEKFCILELYGSTTCFKIVNNAKRIIFVAEISGMIGSHRGFEAYFGIVKYL